jgi:hypothetical protein
VPRARRESRRRRRKLIQTPEGILVNGMLDEDRERRGEDRGEQEAEESGEWRVESGYQRGTERRRRWPKALDGAPWVRPDQYALWCCAGEVVGGREGESGRNRLRAEAHWAVVRVIGCGA